MIGCSVLAPFCFSAVTAAPAHPSPTSFSSENKMRKDVLYLSSLCVCMCVFTCFCLSNHAQCRSFTQTTHTERQRMPRLVVVVTIMPTRDEICRSCTHKPSPGEKTPTIRGLWQISLVHPDRSTCPFPSSRHHCTQHARVPRAPSRSSNSQTPPPRYMPDMLSMYTRSPYRL
jgi:hypothetical protein